MNELFKMLAQPMDPEELWGPRDHSPYDNWDAGDVIGVLAFLAILILLVVLPVVYKYTLTYPNSPEIPRQFHEITQPVLTAGSDEQVQIGQIGRGYKSAEHVLGHVLGFQFSSQTAWCIHPPRAPKANGNKKADGLA